MGVALNIDLGELSDEPDELYRLATVANIACGGHAGDEASMARAVSLARAGGARIAAHPSYPDRERFGRVSIAIAPCDLAVAIAAQCRALALVVAIAGMRVELVKPHGALYHDASDPAVAAAILDGVTEALGPVAIVGAPRGSLRDAALARGLDYAREGFADRAYRDGRLVPRSEPGALLVDPAACAVQATRLIESGDIETICVHGDTPGAVAIARAVRDALSSRGLLDERP